MATRRAVIEAALVAERLDLWADLLRAVRENPDSLETDHLVRRIRRASEALGYATDWHLIAHPILTWFEPVENVPGAGLYAERINWDHLTEIYGDRDPGLLPPPPDDAIRWYDENPDDVNWRGSFD